MNWLLIVVLAILIICMIDGYRKGFVRVLISLLSIILTIILVGVVNPYISDFLIDKTPLSESINKKIVTMLESENGNVVAGQVAEQAEDQAIDQVAGQSAYAENQEADAAANQAVTDESGNATGNVAGAVSAEDINQLPIADQTALIKSYAIPAVIKSALIKNNNEEQYSTLAAANFQDYVAKYLTNTIIKVISFFITFIIITIVLRLTFFTLDFIANLPVIRGINKIAGLGIGLVQGVLIIWIAFFAVVFFAGNDISSILYAKIDANPFLKVLFDYNMILNYVLNKSFLV